MNLNDVIILLLLFTTITLVGCYTKFGYHEPTYHMEQQHKQIEKTDKKMELASDSDMGTEQSDTDGYYGRRKSTYRSTYSYADNSYRVPYTPYPYRYYPTPMYYAPHPWYYGYYAPYYGYYGSYYPYRSYYGRYRGSTFYPAFRGTSKRGAVSKTRRTEYRRARYSRSVTSFNQ